MLSGNIDDVARDIDAMLANEQWIASEDDTAKLLTCFISDNSQEYFSTHNLLEPNQQLRINYIRK